MKTIYISDLDGTLLTASAEISDRSKSILNKLASEGVKFSFATARTSATLKYIAAGVNVPLPVILMNGALIYDLASGKYIHREMIPRGAVKAVVSLMKRFGVSGFAYTVEDDLMRTYYDRLATPAMRDFCRERRVKYNKPFSKLPDMEGLWEKDTVYFSFLNTREALDPMYEQLKSDDRITAVYYRDIYRDGLWYLELLSGGASKRKGADFLKRFAGADRMVCFGDNLNDLPLFEAADESYAVANAHDEVKARSNGVIASNADNGVAKWLLQNAHPFM